MQMEERKKALVVATVVSFCYLFEQDNLRLLQEMGYEVHVAAGKSITGEIAVKTLRDMGLHLHRIDFERSPLSLRNLRAYRQLRELMKREQFSLVHCHTPMGGVIGRMAAKKERVPFVLYTAHGFHFYKGAPLRNWMVYYPIEKKFAKQTDVLITIATEDYRLAQKKLFAKHVIYVPGVGIDLKKFTRNEEARAKTRESLGLKKDQVLALAVGECNENKNHTVLVEMMKDLEADNVICMVAGGGELEEKIKKIAKKAGVEDRFRMLGYRRDIPALLSAADIFLLPSKREGLNVSMMEAMAAGLPCICGNIRGNRDLILENKGGFLVDVNRAEEMREALLSLAKDVVLRKRFGAFNENRCDEVFSSGQVRKRMREIYEKAG